VAQKTSRQERLIQVRVRALAIMCLTRRSDLIVREETTDIGLDLLVTVRPKAKEGLRQFGADLKGRWSALTPDTANAGLRPSLQKIRRYGPFPFPVVLFLFTMEDDKGWYTWVAEPVIAPDGSAEMRQHGEAHCRPLDDEAVDGIVDEVDRWYDAFFARGSKVLRSKGKSRGANN
jgi:hypothetical protein